MHSSLKVEELFKNKRIEIVKLMRDLEKQIVFREFFLPQIPYYA